VEDILPRRQRNLWEVVLRWEREKVFGRKKEGSVIPRWRSSKRTGRIGVPVTYSLLPLGSTSMESLKIGIMGPGQAVPPTTRVLQRWNRFHKVNSVRTRPGGVKNNVESPLSGGKEAFLDLCLEQRGCAPCRKGLSAAEKG